MKEPEIIDLPPRDWRSQDARAKPHEPIFGPGLPGAVAYIFGFVVIFSLSYWLMH